MKSFYGGKADLADAGVDPKMTRTRTLGLSSHDNGDHGIASTGILSLPRQALVQSRLPR